MNTIILLILCQIILESFPVSSSGHMLLLEKILNKLGFQASALSDNFDYFLHGPTILILLMLFWRDWFYPFKKLFQDPFKNKKIFQTFLKICGFVFVTTIIAVLFHGVIKGRLSKFSWFESDWLLLCGFCITAVLLFLLLWKDSTQASYGKLNFKKVLIIGIVQGCALLPGISRFASVYATSRLLNLSPRRAFQFTFLIQFPLIVAGFGLGVFKLLQSPDWMNFFTFKINLTFLVATVIAFAGLVLMQKLALNKRIGYICFYMFIPISIIILLMIF